MSTATAGGKMMIAKRLLDSTIGLKFVMAVTGLAMVGFVVGHMAGNLQAMLPMPADGLHPINKYAYTLQSMGGLLWIARGGLLVMIVLHIVAAKKLTARNAAARPVQYGQKENLQASKTSYLMLLSGLVILFFLLYHLAHFTLGIVDAGAFTQFVTVNGVKYHDVYNMVAASFSQPLVAGLYIVANVLLGLHLHHAASSMFQTLGWRTGGYKDLVDKIGPTIAVVVIAGNVSIPLWFLVGMHN